MIYERDFDQRREGASLARWFCAMWRWEECQDADVADGAGRRDVWAVCEVERGGWPQKCTRGTKCEPHRPIFNHGWTRMNTDCRRRLFDTPKMEIPTVEVLHGGHMITQVHRRCVESPHGRRSWSCPGQFEHRANTKRVEKQDHYDAPSNPGKSRTRRWSVRQIGFGFAHGPKMTKRLVKEKQFAQPALQTQRHGQMRLIGRRPQ